MRTSTATPTAAHGTHRRLLGLLVAPPPAPWAAPPPCCCVPVSTHQQQQLPHKRRGGATVAGASKGFGAKPVDPGALAGQNCPCGSRKRYAECCEPLHKGAVQASTAEQQLRARFSAFVKGEEGYVVDTFHHDTYLPFKYPYIGERDEQLAQLRRDVKMACSSYEFSGLKVISATESGDEAKIEFTYTSRQRTRERRTNSRHTRVKAAAVDRNLDGSVKVEPTVELSKFVRDPARGTWLFSEFELKKFPEWMAEAKEAELASRKQRGEQLQETAAQQQ